MVTPRRGDTTAPHHPIPASRPRPPWPLKCWDIFLLLNAALADCPVLAWHWKIVQAPRTGHVKVFANSPTISYFGRGSLGAASCAACRPAWTEPLCSLVHCIIVSTRFRVAHILASRVALTLYPLLSISFVCTTLLGITVLVESKDCHEAT